MSTTPAPDRPATRWRIGIDVGGTFTDLVAVPGDGDRWDLAGALTHKVPSTPHDPSEGVETGLAALLGAQIRPDDVVALTHGTTIGLNAILQGRGARCALVTSRGHRDVLQIARARMPRSFDLHATPPAPVVPRERVVEVDRRFAPDGAATGGWDPEAVDDVAARLAATSPEVVTVSLLGGYAAADAEVALATELADRLGVPVTSAAQVWPQAGEYERTTLALLDAAITPLMSAYFTSLRERLERLGVGARVYIATSNGGSVSLEAAVERPVQTVLSGPASGVSAAASSWPGLDMVTVDMGGTSSDIGVLRGGRPVLTTTASVGPHPLMTPVVEVSAIGAGGGSIIRGDRSGARPVLRVGPASTGAVPGPACYAAGGQEPALTDAYVHAGVIDPDGFLGGTFPLRADLATAALDRVAHEVPDAVGGDGDATADDVVDAAFRLASAGMAAQLRTVLAAQGEVPESFTFVAFGGAGATHAALLATEVGVRRVLVPATAGTFCALGAAVAPVRRDLARTVRTVLSEDAVGTVLAQARIMEEEALAWLCAQRLPSDADRRVTADLRYAGQPTNLEVPLVLEGGVLDLDRVREEFDAEHARVHGFADPGAALHAETLRLTVTVPPGELVAGERPGSFRRRGERAVRYDGTVRTATVVGLDADGEAGVVTGPAVVDKPDTTVLVPAGWRASCDAVGTVLLERIAEATDVQGQEQP